ncbi:MAG: hypothetical protein PXZ07_05505 [Candidatus Eremiobacteraeota bacterium]|nr:hypothetical protein [Candidatus Eremiobacteraeota bacterium]
MNATATPNHSTLLRSIALAAMLGTALVGIARGAGDRTLHLSAAVAGTRRVVFDCSKTRVSCDIVAVGSATEQVQVTANVSGPDAANVEILRKPGSAHFVVTLKDQPTESTSLWSIVSNVFHPTSWYRPSAYATVQLSVPSDRELDISNTNDRIHVSGVRARLSLADVNGSIWSSDSANVHASTVNGSLHLALPAETPEVGASSVNGSIDVTLAGNFSGRVSASTVNGHIANPFGNGSGPGRLSLSTVNGSITLHHR